MVDLSTARQNIVSEIIDGTPNTITPSKLRQLLTDTIDAIDAVLLPFSVFDADAAPTADDDGANTSGNGVFAVGSKWYDQNAGEAYECLNNATGAAVWAPTTIDISDLGTAAAYNAGTSPNNIVQLNESGELPVVSGANLTNLPGTDASTEFLDDVFRIQDNADPTKEIDFNASGIATGTKRTITAPDRNIDLGNVKKINDEATAAPTTSDDSGDGYTVGSFWNDISTKAAYILFDNSLGAAVWKSIAFLSDLAATTGAALIGYDNTTSGLTATDAQAAIDELAGNSGGAWTEHADGEVNLIINTSGWTFSSIPSGVTELELCLIAVSANGTHNGAVQLGDSGGLESGNYHYVSFEDNTNAVGTSPGSYLALCSAILSNATYYGVINFRRSGTNQWTHRGYTGYFGTNEFHLTVGVKTLSEELTQLKFYPSAGAFDNGLVVLRYR